MDEHRKSAYRYLLYWAMLDIRRMAWSRFRTFEVLNPFRVKEWVREVRRAGTIADWLHNLALFSALDFVGFNEEWFWNELQSYHGRNPEYGFMAYRDLFNTRLAIGDLGGDKADNPAP